MNIEYKFQQINEQNLYEILTILDNDFNGRLSNIKDLKLYSNKLIKNSILISAHDNNLLIGICAFYANDLTSKTAFLSMLGVIPEYRQFKIATQLLKKSILYLKQNNFKNYKLEVYKNNLIAQNFYKKFGFEKINEDDESYYLNYKITQ